jgi:hypothetical protein
VNSRPEKDKSMAKPPKDPIDRIRLALDKGGLAGVGRAIERVAKQAEDAQKPFEKLAQAIDDPRLRRAAGEALAVADATRKLNDQARERLALETRRASVMSGAYGRELRAHQVITRERERVEAMERRAQFQSRYGRLGGAVAYHADTLANSRAARAAVGVAGAGAALGVSGFSGTVEWNRLRLEIELVSRELAGAFRPAVEWATRAMNQLRMKMEGMSERQQNGLLLGGLALGGLATLGLARAGIGAVGLGGAARAIGGLGAAGGALAAHGLMTDNPMTAGLGGAAIGWRVGGPIGALALGTASAAAAAPAHRPGERPFDYYDRMRGEGASRFGAGFATGARAIATLFGATAKEPGAPGAASDRRRVTIADAGFEGVGSARDRLTTALALVDANTSEKSERDILADIWKLLKETIAGGGPAPRPTL